LLGFCVNAEPADVFADLLELGCVSTLDAAVAAFELVTFSGALVWLKADPAADFAALLDPSLLKTLDAADAALLLVTSFFAMGIYL
jgi:hypothetical protein